MRTRGKGRKKATFREHVPYAVFVPLREEGMVLELWQQLGDVGLGVVKLVSGPQELPSKWASKEERAEARGK